ncbi:MAG: nucleotidyl transferase AbiEii/AbiGii toxin family protein [Candidatus Helarchaeota archaeon]
MIDKDQLIKIAKARGLKPFQEEKRYIQLAVLSGIYGYSTIEFVFKGGTCLFFLYGLNRFSEDLDFTLQGNIHWDRFVRAISDKLELLGMEYAIREMKTTTGKNFKIRVRGPLYSIPLSSVFVKIELSERRDIFLPPITSDIYPKYPDILPFSVFSMDPQEIAAEKVRALLKRNYARDLYDLHFLLKKGYIPTLELINKKLNLYEEKFDSNKFKEAVFSKESTWIGELKSLIIGPLVPFSKVAKIVLHYI